MEHYSELIRQDYDIVSVGTVKYMIKIDENNAESLLKEISSENNSSISKDTESQINKIKSLKELLLINVLNNNELAALENSDYKDIPIISKIYMSDEYGILKSIEENIKYSILNNENDFTINLNYYILKNDIKEHIIAHFNNKNLYLDHFKYEAISRSLHEKYLDHIVDIISKEYTILPCKRPMSSSRRYTIIINCEGIPDNNHETDSESSKLEVNMEPVEVINVFKKITNFFKN